MSTHLLPKLRAMGARLSILGNNLQVVAPEDLLTDELLAELKANKNSIIQALKLTDYQQRCRTASTLAELFAVLNEFSQHHWTLCQQSDMSNAYTGNALRLIESEQANKWRVLEGLACFCWKGGAT